MAARFWNKQNASANWTASAPTNWGATSGGTGAAAPTSSDDVTFDGVGTGGNSASTISATITILSFTVTSGYTNTLTHNAVLTVSGNVTLNTSYTIAGSSSMTINATCTLTSGGKTWPNNMTWNVTHTTTLVGNFTITGTLSTGNTQTINWTTNETLTVGGLTIPAAPVSGTATIILNGGTWTATSNAGTINNNLTITGSPTISGTVYYGTGTLKNSGATPTVTSSTLNLQSSCTLDTSGISWNNVTHGAVATLTFTINSLLTVTGTFTQSGTSTSTIFAGTAGFTVATFSIIAIQAVTITLKNSVTYTVTTALTCFTSRNGATLLFTSDDGTLRATLVLTNGATCNCLADFTRIDATGGRTINTFNGTLTSCTNIRSFNDLQTVAG